MTFLALLQILGKNSLSKDLLQSTESIFVGTFYPTSLAHAKQMIFLSASLRGRGCSSQFVGVKKAVLVPLGTFNPKRSTAGAFVVAFRVLSRKKVSDS